MKSIFKFTTSNAVHVSMNLTEHDVLSAYLMIEHVYRPIMDQLCKEELISLPIPSDKERRKILPWLIENPFIIEGVFSNKKETLSIPLYSSYYEAGNNITIHPSDHFIYQLLSKVLNEYDIPKIYCKRQFSARIVADLILSKVNTKIYTFGEFRDVVGLDPKNYASFAQLERIFLSTNNDIKRSGYHVDYTRMVPEPRSNDFALELYHVSANETKGKQ